MGGDLRSLNDLNNQYPVISVLSLRMVVRAILRLSNMS